MAEISSMLPEALLARREHIDAKLKQIGIGEAPVDPNKRSGKTAASKRAKQIITEAAESSSSTAIPYTPKNTDTHWDFVMKEMMWLGADFQGERKRQVSSAKKLASSVKQYHKTREARRLRELHQAEMKRRKLGAKIGRDVRSWWTKIEKVIAYKQKLQADEERNAEMNKQLVVLVQQTEKYTESLSHTAITDDSDDSDPMDEDDSISHHESDDMTSDSDGRYSSEENRRRNKLRRRKQRQRLTIEEALAAENALMRRSKKKVIDYSRMRLKADKLYGESTASDASGSDGSYSLEEDSDDESTFRQAMHEELLERHQDETDTFLADPDELRKLREEMEMDINEVIRGLEEEEIEPKVVGDKSKRDPRKVQFADTADERTHIASTRRSNRAPNEEPAKYDADDDGDASDVEDYDDTVDQHSDEEFEAKEPELDDETTIAQEEALPRDMSTSDEIALLKRESELPIEELRKLYAKLGTERPNQPISGSAYDQLNRANNGMDTEEELEEFEPPPVPEVDDETTIEAEEKLGREVSHEEEMKMLKRESEIPIEELLAMYRSVGNDIESNDDDDRVDDGDSTTPTGRTTRATTRRATLTMELEGDITGSEDEGGEEFAFDAQEAIDDETTIEAEERLGRDMSYQDEITLLKKESELSIDELRAKYLNVDGDSDIEEIDTLSASAEADDTVDEAGEEEYQPETGEGLDDETTIEQEERLGREMSYEAEMALLKKESEIPVGQLRAMYSQIENEDNATMSDDTEAHHNIRQSSLTAVLSEHVSASEDDGGEEFQPIDGETLDDETTIEAEERLGRDMSYADELNLLKKEGEMSLEELRMKYATSMTEDAEASDVVMEEDNSTEMSDTIISQKRKSSNSDEQSSKRQRIDSKVGTVEDGLAALDALEASAQKAQQTLASRPFLLSGWVKLRKYQQIGLNWLVSLQTRRLNGILADEMGLGKTLQTISLLSYLASYKGIWGPHLIVVPTSVIINWETELKRFCPALKVLCYYGSAKRRKELRQGWTKANWYHVVITSYQLAVQDAFAFKRKKWYYLVLDEAQNIKNFQSQRWQTLINFNTQRRLLLTGTPLQNSLMELWSLLHFLMPYIFRSRKEFSYWFSNPMTNIIEGNTDQNNDVIKRLHGIIRPFVLRRLKKDVETQMPGKFEHIVKCQLSRRQMTLYEEFLSRSSTRQALNRGGNFMGMMNVLMQLRKVCNHPDLFEPRSVITPFVLPSLSYTVPLFVCDATAKPVVSERLSENLLKPIWCGSSGLPSISEALGHDTIRSQQLQRLAGSCTKWVDTVDTIDTEECPDELKALITSVNKARAERKASNVDFHNRNNRTKCFRPPFAYSDTLQSLVQVEQSLFQRTEPVEVRGKELLLTPESLLSMRKSEMERATELDELIDKFVFCVPPAGAREPVFNSNYARFSQASTKNLDDMLLEPLEEIQRPYRKAHARISSFFPDKKLIQFDAGKLQTLAELLRKLKQGGHRVLIFTQMSKMLDILEAFLNIHGHTYLRLDGATGVDRRQRYMDRFNNDSRIFCFILSTRSGGMGINLTGADTVIFYDSDWNPAMDAQAQDRAHRIGQTREVHIYRLMTEHTIEENILMKAKQKKNLDIMVMDQGKFDASHQAKGRIVESSAASDEMKDVYTKGGLRAILGVTAQTSSDNQATLNAQMEDSKDVSDLSNEQMESAMAMLEDEDDVKALQGAQKEAAEEMKEFDESIEIKKDSDGDEDDDEADGTKKKISKSQKGKKAKGESETEAAEEGKNAESDLEKEFAAWQTEVGFDAMAIESSLSPTERYGLLFRENVDPFYSVFYINELRRKSEVTDIQEEIDIEEIEQEKAAEERRAMEDGDLLGTRPRPETLIRQRNLYRREKGRLRADKKRRKLTGENWSQKVDGLTKGLFWYNEDTGEAIWDKPLVLLRLEAAALASEKGWGFLPNKILVNIMAFLAPLPERQSCCLVYHQWKTAASDISFVRHVYPVEMGALSRDGSRRDHNHFGNIEEALSIALPGDTIELSNGHYWVSDAGLLFDKPLRLIGDEHNPANVVIEMSASLQWAGIGGFIEGITFRRPKMTSKAQPSFPMLEISGKGRVDIVHSVLDNDGSTGPVIRASGFGRKGSMVDIVVRNGGSHGVEISEPDVRIALRESTLRGNRGSGIHCSNKAKVFLRSCTVEKNSMHGMVLSAGGTADIQKSRFLENNKGILQRETGCTMTASMNNATVSSFPPRGIPGFKIMLANASNGD